MSDFSRARIDKLNAERLKGVKPELARKCLELIALVRNAGNDLLITTGYRSVAEQNRLYAQGRTKPGKIVTNAKGGQSNHQTGDAVDFAVIVKGAVTWDVNIYKKTIGKYSAQVGLKWGGNWKKFKDYPHVEL